MRYNVPVLDRSPLPPAPLAPFECPPHVRAAIDAFAARLDARDPIFIGFNMTPAAMVVSDPTLPDNPVIYVNPGFERLTGFAACEVLGRNCRFMQGPLTDPSDVEKLRSAVANRQQIEIDLLNHRRDGTPFWNRLMVAPVFEADGTLRYFVASQFDVTIERHRVALLEQDREELAAEIARRDADLASHDARMRMALKAGGLGTWTLDLAHQVLNASSSCKRNFGRPVDEPFTYEQLLGAINPDDAPRMRQAVENTITKGAPYDIEYRILTPQGEQRWVSVQGEMQYRADGSPLSLSGFSTDISDRKFAEEHRAVLARELTHRIKNTLATVNAVVTQTLRDAASLEEAKDSVSGRIASLATAHELLIKDEVEGAGLSDIVRGSLSPFSDQAGDRFIITGPNVRLSPEITLALSMALHELATNAVKYGGLASPHGRVHIAWAIAGGDGERHIWFHWREEGGPPVTVPARIGFGTKMIERMLRRHVRGASAIEYKPAGIEFQIAITA